MTLILMTSTTVILLKASLSQVKLRVGLHRLKNISGLVMLCLKLLIKMGTY